MDDPTAESVSSFVSGMGTDVAANLVTVAGFAFLFALKKICSRDSKCKTKCHLPCIDVEVQDRTQRSEHPPLVSEDKIDHGGGTWMGPGGKLG